MTKRYRSKVVGDGLTQETARKPEFYPEQVTWSVVSDDEDTMVVDVETDDFSVLDKYPDTTEII